jgi:O-antigen ligase
MIEYYKENIQLFIILFVWTIVGMFGGPLIYLVLPLTILLMKQKGLYEELFIGYFFILIISDSLDPRLEFAKSLKNVYISLLAVFVLFDRKAFASYNNLYRTFIPFFIFSGITVLFSVLDPFFFTSVQKTISYFLTFLILPTFISKLYKDHGVQFLKRFLFFAITALFIGFIFKYVAHDVAYLITGRYRGVLGSPNGLGTYSFLLFLIFFITDKFYPNLYTPKIRIIAYSAILLSLYMAGSRNSILSVVIFLAFQRFFSISPFIGFIVFAATLIVSEIFIANIVPIILTLGLEDLFRINTLEDGSGRYVAWGFAWQQIQHNFFIGKGFAYNEYYMRQYYHELQLLGHQGGIHNSFLTFWMDQGLIGLLIYLRSYIIMFVKAAKKTKFAYAIMFAVAFSAMFESWLVGSLSAFAFLSIFVFTLITGEEFVPSLSTVSLEVKSQPELIPYHEIGSK